MTPKSGNRFSDKIVRKQLCAVLAEIQSPRTNLLNRHLRSHFHHPPGRDLEIVGGVIGDAGEPDEQPVLPARHDGMGSRLERTPRQEERRRHDVEPVSYTHLTLPTKRIV